MSSLPNIDTGHLVDFLVKLLNIPSPTGRTDDAIAFVEKEFSTFKQLKLSRTRKGALVAKWEGRKSDSPRALTAHVDTLGAMVKEIKPNGRLKITRIGGLLLNGVETEGCRVFASNGQKLRGSLLIDAASVHVYGEKASETKRSEDHMEIRLDARTSPEKETRELGINIGDFVAFDPRVEVTNGFVRSRFLDDKACVAALAAAIKSLAESGQSPAQNVAFLISNYEEVGHGAAAGIPLETHELVTVDMAAVGDDGDRTTDPCKTIAQKTNCGQYYYAPNSSFLGRIFDEIATRIYTRITE